MRGAIGALLSACLFSVPASAAVQTTKLALNWKPEPQFGGFYAASVGGHFKREGLDVEILPGGAGTPVVQMVAAGRVPFGIASADEIVIARSRGADVVALFAVYQTNPQGIMVHASRAVKGLRDVYADKAGVLAVQRGLPYAMFLENKLGPARVKIVPYQGGIAAFLADKAFAQQCFIASEPLAAKKAGVAAKVFLVADEGYNPYTTVLVARGETIKKDPALVKAMVAAVRAGWAEYLSAPDAANRRMRELNPSMDAQTFTDSAVAQRPLIGTAETKTLGFGAMTEERWRRLVEQLHEMKVIARKPDAASLFRSPPPSVP